MIIHNDCEPTEKKTSVLILNSPIVYLRIKFSDVAGVLVRN